MSELKKCLSAIESSSQDETEPQEIEGGPKDILGFIDLISAKNTKLSGIIDCIRGYRCPAEDCDLGNLAWAMHDFTDAIEKLIDNFLNYLGDIGAYKIEKEKQKSKT